MRAATVAAIRRLTWRCECGAVTSGPPIAAWRQLANGPARIQFLSLPLLVAEERDRRAGPDANPQKRGRVPRELRAELEKALADGKD
jgi:hypothetical protein